MSNPPNNRAKDLYKDIFLIVFEMSICTKNAIVPYVNICDESSTKTIEYNNENIKI